MRKLFLIDYLSLFLFSFVVTVTVMTFVFPPSTRMDFSIYLLVTKIATLHKSLYPLFIGNVPFPYTHPTSLTPFFFPFLFMSPAIAASFWNMISLSSLLVGTFLVIQKTNRTIKLSTLLLILSAVLLLEPVRESLLFGQNNLVVLFFLFLAFIFSKKQDTRNQIIAGLCIGIAASLKLFPLFLIFYFATKKHWISIVISTCIFLCFLLIGTFGHISYLSEYMHYAISTLNSARPLPNDQSASAFLLMFSSVSSFIRQIVICIFYSVTFLLSYAAWRRGGKKEINDFLFFSSITASTILIITPLAWVHHLVFVIPLCLGLFLKALQTKSIGYIIIFIVSFLLFFIGWEDMVISLQTHGYGYFPLFYFHALIGLCLIISVESIAPLISFLVPSKEKYLQ